MQNAKHDGSVHKAVMNLKSAEPTIELKSYAPAGPGLARVVIDVTHTSESRADHTIVLSAIGKKLKNRFVPVANSFNTLSSGAYTDRISGIIGPVHEIISVNRKTLEGFRAMASNMFMDDEKEMWALKKTEAGDVLIKTSAEDDLSLLNLLETTASAGHRSSHEYGQLSAMCSALSGCIEGGDFVSFVDVNNCMCMGFVVATTDEDQALVLQRGADEPELIEQTAITQLHVEDFPEPAMSASEVVDNEVAMASGRVDIEGMVEYYRKIYSRDPRFFAEFEKRIRSHQFA